MSCAKCGGYVSIINMVCEGCGEDYEGEESSC
jgi:hypothetical protein